MTTRHQPLGPAWTSSIGRPANRRRRHHLAAMVGLLVAALIVLLMIIFALAPRATASGGTGGAMVSISDR